MNVLQNAVYVQLLKTAPFLAARPNRPIVQQARRDEMRDRKICINASFSINRKLRPSKVRHGKVYKAGKCRRCYRIHKHSRDAWKQKQQKQG